LISISLVENCDRLILKTCAGWALGRYPEVKKFVYDDAKHFSEGFLTDLNAGGKPRLACFIGETETITDVHTLTRVELRNKVVEMGFSMLDTMPQLQPEEVDSEF